MMSGFPTLGRKCRGARVSPSADETVAYAYNPWNGLVETETRGGGLSVGYTYDALDRRAWTASGSVTNYYAYDGAQVVADLDANGQVVRSYIHAPGIDRLLAIVVHGATDTKYACLTDHLGTVHALADAAGNIVESYEYDAWGNVLAVRDGAGNPLSESAIGNRYLFQGREYSWATGLYNFRARWYDPETGRWMSSDPIGISGGLNQYVFCANNPVNMVDPDGLRVINSSDRTIPVVVNEKLPGGKQGPQEILYLPPGGDTDVLKPGWDTDGIFPPADNTRVIKLVDDVIAEVLPSGGVRFPWYNNPIDTGLQLIFGGWKDEAFLNQWKWPRPDPDKCK